MKLETSKGSYLASQYFLLSGKTGISSAINNFSSAGAVIVRVALLDRIFDILRNQQLALSRQKHNIALQILGCL